MGDEPTIGEVGRQITDLRRSVDGLAGRVLTVEVWKAERESIEIRLRENEKDIAVVQAEAKAERERRELEKRQSEDRAAALRRQVLFVLVSSFVAPILVGVILAVMLRS